MYELIVLSVLMQEPAHGYLIAKTLNNVIGPFARASNGRIYPLLAKLEAAGMIEAFESVQDGRPLRRFRITEKGRQRFRELMLDTASNPREYQELFSFKVSVLSYLEPRERLHLIDHYIHYCQAHILHLQQGIAGLAGSRSETEAGDHRRRSLRAMMEHRLRQWEAELAWARQLREEVPQP